MELRRRERYWIETLKPALNSSIPTRTEKEYKQTDEFKKRKQVWSKQYYIKNKQQKDEYSRKWRLANIEKVKAYSKIYSQMRDAKRVECPCGGRYSDKHKTAHFKTKKHTKYEASI
jgi:hypothetical protein